MADPDIFPKGLPRHTRPDGVECHYVAYGFCNKCGWFDPAQHKKAESTESAPQRPKNLAQQLAEATELAEKVEGLLREIVKASKWEPYVHNEGCCSGMSCHSEEKYEHYKTLKLLQLIHNLPEQYTKEPDDVNG